MILYLTETEAKEFNNWLEFQSVLESETTILELPSKASYLDAIQSKLRLNRSRVKDYYMTIDLDIFDLDYLINECPFNWVVDYCKMLQDAN